MFFNFMFTHVHFCIVEKFYAAIYMFSPQLQLFSLRLILSVYIFYKMWSFVFSLQLFYFILNLTGYTLFLFSFILTDHCCYVSSISFIKNRLCFSITTSTTTSDKTFRPASKMIAAAEGQTILTRSFFIFSIVLLFVFSIK